MAAIYVLNTLDNKRAVSETFDSKKAAKLVRNKLKNENGITSIVSRGPDHPAGPSTVDPRCQNKDRTSRKKRRSRITDAIEETLADLRKVNL